MYRELISNRVVNKMKVRILKVLGQTHLASGADLIVMHHIKLKRTVYSQTTSPNGPKEKLNNTRKIKPQTL